MVTIGTRLLRAGLLFSLIALFVSGAAFEPSQAIAKTINSGGSGGGPYGTGDPTGDDQPSPTPKPTARAPWGSKETTAGTSAQGQRYSGFGSSERWSLYLRLLVRLALR